MYLTEQESTFVLNPNEVKEEFIRTSGKGGQNRNKVETCVRLTYLPTGLQVVADTERTQAKNRDIAWKRLEEKLVIETQKKEKKNENQSRIKQFSGSRDWTWTQWRDSVTNPDGVTASYKNCLKGRLSKFIK